MSTAETDDEEKPVPLISDEARQNLITLGILVVLNFVLVCVIYFVCHSLLDSAFLLVAGSIIWVVFLIGSVVIGVKQMDKTYNTRRYY